MTAQDWDALADSHPDLADHLLSLLAYSGRDARIAVDIMPADALRMIGQTYRQTRERAERQTRELRELRERERNTRNLLSRARAELDALDHARRLQDMGF